MGRRGSARTQTAKAKAIRRTAMGWAMVMGKGKVKATAKDSRCPMGWRWIWRGWAPSRPTSIRHQRWARGLATDWARRRLRRRSSTG